MANIPLVDGPKSAPFHASIIRRGLRFVMRVLVSDSARPLRQMLRPIIEIAARISLFGRWISWVRRQRDIPIQDWYHHYRHNADYAGLTWRGDVRISIIMPVYKTPPPWLNTAVNSVIRQTYPYWELLCIDDGSQDPRLTAILERAAADDIRVRVIVLDRNQGVSRATNEGLRQAAGDYILFMDHDDLLEPHALARLADAAFSEDSDLLYGDEVITGESIEEIARVAGRPEFSHAYYLSHPFFVHPVAVRTAIAREIGGINSDLVISQDIDFVLRVLEVAKSVTHVPDILYRWRTHAGSAGHEQQGAVMARTCTLKTEHLKRIGFPDAVVREGASFNTFKVTYFGMPAGRILGIIPTKNRCNLLRKCIETIRSTTRNLHLDLLVVDHQSDDPETLTYLRDIQASGAARVLRYEGTFNFSAMNNQAVYGSEAVYDYFLFLNNDIEATTPGWLDAMLDLATRNDVGVVGATLLYPDGRVQHSGVIVGLCGTAEHAFKTLPFGSDNPGYCAGLHATCDYSAVTAACMLIPAEAFHAVGGFDEDLVVGYNDTDLCLRIGQTGRRILNCADAVLIHHESASRGQSLDRHDSHPLDTGLFVSRYKSLIQAGDPHFSPLLATDNPTFIPGAASRFDKRIRYRTVTDFLPTARRRLLVNAEAMIAAE